MIVRSFVRSFVCRHSFSTGSVEFHLCLWLTCQPVVLCWDSPPPFPHRRLKELLDQDDESYRLLLSSLDETKEQRIDRMRQRVDELREKKEIERKKIVQEKLLLKWRGDCDELRLVESKGMVSSFFCCIMVD